MEHVQPCPFCGGENIRVRQDDVLSYYFICVSCKSRGPRSVLYFEAREMWNRRQDVRGK
jgi:Lar family restriction alleviation protein